MKDDALQNMLNHLTHAVLLVDNQCKILFMTPSAEALLGISKRMASHFDLATLPISDGSVFGDYLNKSLASGSAFTHREMIIELPEQKRSITVDCTVSIYGDDSQQLLIELAQVDRIMRIAKEEQLLIQHQASREVMRGVAHEVKNPLGGIRGAAQLLQREIPQEQHEFTQIIIAEVDRLQNLVNRMLGPNRPSQKGEHNILEILEHIVRLLNAETDHRINFIKDYDPSIPNIYADRDQLIQALLNIVRNAWEALGESGDITLRTRALRRFTIGTVTHRLVLALEIIDNGPGIPKNIIEKIFYPMVTGRSEGTGLGLPIAQSLINQHDGLIECDSEPGRTRFTVFIPITAGDQS